MSWKSVVKQCRFDCVGTGLFSVANMVFLLVLPVLSIVVSLAMISTHVDEHVASGLMGGCGGLASAMAWFSWVVVEERGLSTPSACHPHLSTSD